MVDLFLETAARPFLLASSAFLHALTENREHRGAIKITNNERVQVNNVRLLIQTLQLQYKLMSIETLGSIDEHQASDVTRSSSGGSDK